MLHKLEDNHGVEAKVTQAGNRPQRNQYSITAAGKGKFDEWLTLPVRKGRDFRIAFLLKMYFVLKLGGNTAESLIQNQKNACEGWIEELNTAVKNSEGQNFNRIVENFRLTQINGYIQWLDWCQKNLKTIKN